MMYSKPCQTSKMECFKKIVIYFSKRSILGVQESSETPLQHNTLLIVAESNQMQYAGLKVVNMKGS